MQTPRALTDIAFDDDFTRALPGDPETANVPRAVRGALYSFCAPERAPKPILRAVTRDLAENLGFSEAETRDPAFAALFSGGPLPPGCAPYAMCYGGHQFGSWAGQLGDGRAINLGELPARDGVRVALQLKGAGPTPYSRRGDGYAVLRSSLREFACGEAMHALGVPTTRALCLVTTGREVLRDALYDGNAKFEPGAVVCRAAESFVRFGNFELCAARGDRELLRKLADYVLRRHFPECAAPGARENDADAYLRMFAEITRRTATLIARWQCVGFVHGVMNTDNMAITGVTIDYGPYGFLEPYDLDWTPNTTDARTRRYAYGNQPAVGAWNIARLARALHPLIPDAAALQAETARYAERFESAYLAGMRRKLGLGAAPDADLVALLVGLDALFAATEIDMTIFFRALGDAPPRAADAARDFGRLREAFYGDDAAVAKIAPTLEAWLDARERLLDPDRARRRATMRAANPKYVLRNYLALLAIEAAEREDYAPLERLLEILRAPYDDRPGAEAYAARRPEWARERVGASALSCSS